MQLVNLTDDLDVGEEKESDKIRAKIADLSYRINTCNFMEELQKTNANFTVRTEVSLEAQEEYMKKLPGELDKIHEEVKELTKVQDLLAKELKEAEKEEAKPLIMAELVTENAGEVPFLLEYKETYASWAPKYEVRFNGTNEPLSVIMKAAIHQSSKEDWKQVKVTLFSGNPAATDTIPDLKSLQLSFYEPAPVPASSPMMGGPMMGFMGMAAANMAGASANAMSASAAPMAMMSMDAMKQMNALQTAEAVVSEEDSMTAFELPDLRDILSDTSGNLDKLAYMTGQDYFLYPLFLTHIYGITYVITAFHCVLQVYIKMLLHELRTVVSRSHDYAFLSLGRLLTYAYPYSLLHSRNTHRFNYSGSTYNRDSTLYTKRRIEGFLRKLDSFRYGYLH